MKQKALNLLFLCVVLLGLTACKDTKLKPTQIQIDGPLGEYFEVVDRNYTLKTNGDFSVELKRIAEGGPKSIQVGSYEIHVNFLDANGSLISSSKIDGVMNGQAFDDITNLAVGETAQVSIPFSGSPVEKSNVEQFKVMSKNIMGN